MSNTEQGGVIVYTREVKFHYPTGVTWLTGHLREGAEYPTSDLDVLDASGKVVATFQAVYWSGVEFAR